MSIICFKLRMFKSYIWNLTCRVNDKRIFLSWFFTIFHHFRNVSKEQLRRRPVWQDSARTTVKLKRPHSYLQTISHDSFLVSLDSVHFVSFQAYSTLCCIKLYGVPDTWYCVWLSDDLFSRRSSKHQKHVACQAAKCSRKQCYPHWQKGLCSPHTSIDCHKSGP